MKKNMFKVMALIMTLAMVFGFAACNSSNATNDGVRRSGTADADTPTEIKQVFTPQLTNITTDGTLTLGQVLYITQTDDAWENNYPFDTLADAEDVDWDLVDFVGAANPFVVNGGSVDTSSYTPSNGLEYNDEPDLAPTGSGYYATGTVGLSSSAPSTLLPGVYSFEASSSLGSVNFTLAVDDPSADEAENITVYIIDSTNSGTGPNLPVKTGSTIPNVTVDSPASSSSDPLYESTSPPEYAFQYDPSAAGTLWPLETSAYIDGFTYFEGYVSEIDGLSGSGSNGWQYAVYDTSSSGNGGVLSLSSVVSPAVYPINSDYSALWYYGPWGMSPATLYPTWASVVTAFGSPN